MRKTLLAICMAMMMPLASVTAQTYTSLWKQVDVAERKDLPQTQIGVLNQIVHKAEQEKAYGQLLKASVKRLNLQVAVAPDSLKPAVAEMTRKERLAKDAVLKAVYDVALYRIYNTAGKQLADNADSLALHYRQAAMSQPDRLAQAKAGGYSPFVVNGTDSRYFNDDMLSVVGYETGVLRPVVDYYYRQGNRRATCLAGLALANTMPTRTNEDFRKSRHIHRLDSLIKVFGDLEVAGEVAVERYHYMCGCKNVTPEDKISYIHYALDRWGGWQRMNELRNAEKSLTQSAYAYRINSRVAVPDSAQNVYFQNLRNLKQLTLRVYRTDLDGKTRLDPAIDADYQKLRRSLTELPQYALNRTFVGYPDYQTFADTARIAGLPAGVYMLEVETSPATTVSRTLYFVSGVQPLSLPLPGKAERYVVVDAASGQPLAGAKVELTVSSNGRVRQAPRAVTLTCNAKGEAVYTRSENEVVGPMFAYTDKDRAFPEHYERGTFYYGGRDASYESTTVMTDRSIYRPGQTVHVAAVVYRHADCVKNEAITGKTVKAVLRNANYEIVAEKSLITDSYGTCSADFVLPAGGLTGRYLVNVNGSSRGFRVEEYKRPTFQVEFPKVNEKYQSGDTLLVKGKALTYAGVPVQGAKVTYRVNRSTALWWRGFARYDESEVGLKLLSEQTTTTAADGSFTVEMPLVMPDDAVFPMFYHFTVNADVTDLSGETHNGQLSVPLGTRPVALTTDVPSQVLGDSLRQIGFQLRNASGLNVSAPVRFYIDNDKEWHAATTTQPYFLKKQLASGRHRLFAVCENDTVKHDFTVFSLDDKKPATDTREWFYASASQFAAGQPVTVQVGSSDRDVHVLYHIFAGDKVLESGSTDLNNALVNRKFTYKDSYGDGLTLAYAWVKDGQVHTRTFAITRPYPDNKLTLSWATFRDKLTPGQQETWTLKVNHPNGKPADAQLMATLYDKSLDQLRAHQWYFSPRYSGSPASVRWRYAFGHILSGAGDRAINNLTARTLDFSHFDMNFDFLEWSSGRHKVFYAVENAVSMPRHYDKLSATSSAKEVMRIRGLNAGSAQEDASAADNGAGDAGDELSAQGNQPVQLRENQNETAFFYPALHTAKDGSVALTFTLPESLTTWRFMGLAHTADMSSGMIESEVVARKEVMIQPNVPRFVRMGDKSVISAKIFNTADKDVSGTARLELSDPETGRAVYAKSIPFSVGQGQTTAVAFDYQPGEDVSLLVCKMTAAGRNFSDGEQHYLPVLPDRERVTVTVPFTQTAPGIRQIDLTRLYPAGTRQHRLTVEYTNNPAWLMVQALPAIGEVRTDNAVDQCAALYVNILGMALLKQSPRVKTVFEQWKREQGNETSLQSQLQKNQDLKNLAIDETPWVGEAKAESEQKQRLADFFDTSTLQNRLQTAADKLASLQQSDGSWSWWNGMNGNQYLTVSIAEKLVRLNVMAGPQSLTGDLLDRAFAFMDSEVVKEVERLKQYEKRHHRQPALSHTDIQYLYLRALDGRKASVQVKEACDYLVGLLKKDIKGQSIQDKALSAIILAKRGETALAKTYVKSLKEYSVYTDEMGRYYDTPRAGYSWCDYRIPTEVAVIEALQRVTPDDRQTIDEMRRWLLQEKRTQAWDTPLNSINAVYAFLFDQTAVLDAGENTVIALDGKPLDLPKATAGLGYVKTSVDCPAGKTLTAKKTSQGTSWGAVYAQFMQPAAEVEQSGGELTVKREIVRSATDLKVGARIKVRITVEARRDLDFVQIQDRRAACMEPVRQLSGYRDGYYCAPKDNATCYYFDRLSKGKHVLETEYYVDRVGDYETGTCTAVCAYAPEFRAVAKSERITVSE